MKQRQKKRRLNKRKRKALRAQPRPQQRKTLTFTAGGLTAIATPVSDGASRELIAAYAEAERGDFDEHDCPICKKLRELEARGLIEQEAPQNPRAA